ncbi:MAG TPA: hypothetical protein ENK72_01915 [Epsilonproteobacteria bacterium]|nr:hypothetical protein [Campylobacterota bacterium]
MKFMVTKDLKFSRFYTVLITALTAAMLLFLILDVVLHGYLIGADMTAMKTTLYGNPETFEEPILFDSLLLQVHIDLFITLFLVMILASLLIRFSTQARPIKVMVHLLFVTGALTPLLLLAAYFWGEVFLYLWLAGFALWHLLGVTSGVMVVRHLVLR